MSSASPTGPTATTLAADDAGNDSDGSLAAWVEFWPAILDFQRRRSKMYVRAACDCVVSVRCNTTDVYAARPSRIEVIAGETVEIEIGVRQSISRAALARSCGPHCSVVLAALLVLFTGLLHLESSIFRIYSQLLSVTQRHRHRHRHFIGCKVQNGPASTHSFCDISIMEASGAVTLVAPEGAGRHWTFAAGTYSRPRRSGTRTFRNLTDSQPTVQNLTGKVSEFRYLSGERLFTVPSSATTFIMHEMLGEHFQLPVSCLFFFPAEVGAPPWGLVQVRSPVPTTCSSRPML